MDKSFLIHKDFLLRNSISRTRIYFQYDFILLFTLSHSNNIPLHFHHFAEAKKELFNSPRSFCTLTIKHKISRKPYKF